MYLSKKAAESIAFLVLYSLIIVAISAGSPKVTLAQTPSASPASFGVLQVTGTVLVNGLEAADGTTVFSESRVETKENSSAVVSVPRSANIEIGCSSVVKISYGPNVVDVTVISGYARLTSYRGVKGTLTWSGGEPRRTDSNIASSTVDSGEPNVCGPVGVPPGNAPVAGGPVATASSGGLWGLGTLGTALLIGGGGLAIAAIALARRGPNCDNLPAQAVSNVKPCN